jgi:hypothetical protein
MEYYDVWNPLLTHGSVQNTSLVEDFGRAVTLRDVYKKAIIYDEVGYEGNFPERWGNLSAEEMVHRFWQGLLVGTYVTHGETYSSDDEIVRWAKGGVLKGESPARIGFLRNIIEKIGSLELVDKWKDHRMAATKDLNTFIIYFGREVVKEWEFCIPARPSFSLPAGDKYKAEILDTWNMSISPVDEIFVIKEKEGYRILDKDNRKITLPETPYMAIRLNRLHI